MAEYDFSAFDGPKKKYDFSAFDTEKKYDFSAFEEKEKKATPEQAAQTVPDVYPIWGETTRDVAIQIPTGAAKALVELGSSINSLSQELEQVMPLGAINIEKERTTYISDATDLLKQQQKTFENIKKGLPEAETTPGAVAGGLTQFATGFALTRKTPVGGIKNWWLRNYMAGALTDFSFFDPYEKRLSNIAAESDTAFSNDFTKWLASDKEDSELEARLKQTLEGGLIGLGMDAAMKGLGSGLRQMKGIMQARAELPKANALLDQLQPAITEYRHRGLNQMESLNRALADAGLVKEEAFEAALKTGRKINYRTRPDQSSESILRAVKGAEKETVRGKVFDAGKSALDSVESALGNVHTSLKNISEELGHKMRWFEMDSKVYSHNFLERSQNFLNGMDALQKSRKVKQPALYYDISLRIQNQDFTGAKQVANRIKNSRVKTAVLQGLDDVRSVLDELHAAEREINPDIGYLHDHFPRNVKDYAKYVEKRGGDASKLGLALRDTERKLGRSLTKTEITDEVAKLTQKSVVPMRGVTQTDAAKQRVIEQLTAKDLVDYDPVQESLTEYIHHVTHHVQKAKFFGSAAKNLDENINNLIGDMVHSGKLEAKDADSAIKLLGARFGKGESGASRGFQNLKNSFYAVTLNDPSNALVQAGDLSLAAYKHGTFRSAYTTMQEVAKSIRRTTEFAKSKLRGDIVPDRGFREAELHMKDFGLDLPAEEFRSTTATAKYIRGLFKLTGFKQMDTLGKNVHLNSSFKKWVAKMQTDKGIDEFVAKYGKAYDDAGLKKAIKDFKAGRITRETKFIPFSELADVQPINLSEMPKWYLEHPDGRILYTLRSFTLKLLDVIRNDVYNQIKSGNTAQGVWNGTKLTFLFTMAGMSIDTARDWWMGKDESIEQKFVNNLWKMIGLSDYIVNKAMDEPSSAAITALLMPPVGAVVDPITEDLKNWGETANSLKLGPYGKTIYNWFGGGLERYRDWKEREED